MTLHSEVAQSTFHQQVREILRRKSEDYGTANINQTGRYGVAVRLVDKVTRLHHLLATGADPLNEPVLDTVLDIAGYATILHVLITEGEWS